MGVNKAVPTLMKVINSLERPEGTYYSELQPPENTAEAAKKGSETGEI